ncbi:hypothetical protein T4A_11352 [Trichinella pseudospiralis]|uniref:Uncharacterized protein n=1 Tax=Trichinella pseudospiralis TaxID=6337 RepID=A0A0V1ERI4_TRIPS|nr:hypothetical protein T4A_11352 [Trichinella pseudospiralis]
MRFTCRCLNVYVDAMVDRPVEGGLETVEQLLAEHDTLPEIRDHLGDQGRLYFRFRIREKGLELLLVVSTRGLSAARSSCLTTFSFSCQSVAMVEVDTWAKLPQKLQLTYQIVTTCRDTIRATHVDRLAGFDFVEPRLCARAFSFASIGKIRPRLTASPEPWIRVDLDQCHHHLSQCERLPGFVRTEQLRAHWCRYHCILCRLTFFVNAQHVPHEILMPNDMLADLRSSNSFMGREGCCRLSYSFHLGKVAIRLAFFVFQTNGQYKHSSSDVTSLSTVLKPKHAEVAASSSILIFSLLLAWLMDDFSAGIVVIIYKECQITMVKQLNNYSEVFQVLLPEKREPCMSNTSSFEVELDTNYLVSLNDRQLQSFVSKYLGKLRDEMDERIKKFLKKEQKEYESNQKKVKVEKAWLLQLMAEFNQTESAAARVGKEHAQRYRSDAEQRQKVVEEEESENESENSDQNGSLNDASRRRRRSSSSNSSSSSSDESNNNNNNNNNNDCQNDLLKSAILLANDGSGKKSAANNNNNNNNNNNAAYSDDDEEVMAEEIVNISPVMVYPSGPSQRKMGPDVQVEYFENRGFFDPLSVIDSNRMNIDDEEEDGNTQNAGSPPFAVQLPSPPTPKICSAKGVANNPESLAHPKRKRHSGGTGKPPKLNSQNEDVTQDVICCVNEFDLLSSHYLAIDSPIPHAGAGGCGGADGRYSSKDIFANEYNNCTLRSSNATVARGRNATGVKINNNGMHKEDYNSGNENSGGNNVVDAMQLENIPNLADDSVVKLSTASSRANPVSEPIDIPGAGWRQDHAFLLFGQQDLHGQNQQRPQDLAASMNALARSLQHHDDPERMFGERPHRRRFRTYCGGY